MFHVADAFRAGMSVEDVHALSFVDPWFLDQIAIQVAEVGRASPAAGSTDRSDAKRLRALEAQGFSDARMAPARAPRIRGARCARRSACAGVQARGHCAAEFATTTAYLYSTYEDECEAQPTDRDKIMVLGGGPNRIGQGIEFDYCCVHAALALREDGFETIMVNCNPETVSPTTTPPTGCISSR